MSNCDHVSKVLEWGYTLTDGNFKEHPSLYGCTKCDATSEVPFPSIDAFIDHTNCDEKPCFGCKAKGLQLSTGDANSRVHMTTRAHDIFPFCFPVTIRIPNPNRKRFNSDY